MQNFLPEGDGAEYLAVLALLPIVLGSALGAATEPLYVAVAVAALFWVTFAGGLRLDPFIGFLAGLFAAAALVFFKQQVGAWQAASFLPQALIAVLLPATGSAAAILGRRLRTRQSQDKQPAEAGGVLGAFQFLSEEYGKARLDEEIERAEMFGRPLSLLHVTAEISSEDALSAVAGQSAHRTVARLVEGIVRVTDIPFTYHDEEGRLHIAYILPETTLEEARRLAALHREATQQATFSDPRSERRYPLAKHARIKFTAVSGERQGGNADALLETARASDEISHRSQESIKSTVGTVQLSPTPEARAHRQSRRVEPHRS